MITALQGNLQKRRIRKLCHVSPVVFINKATVGQQVLGEEKIKLIFIYRLIPFIDLTAFITERTVFHQTNGENAPVTAHERGVQKLIQLFLGKPIKIDDIVIQEQEIPFLPGFSQIRKTGRKIPRIICVGMILRIVCFIHPEDFFPIFGGRSKYWVI